MLRSILSVVSSRKAQTAIEYMLLLGVVVAAVLIFFKRDASGKMQKYGNLYFNHITTGVMGQKPRGKGIP